MGQLARDADLDDGVIRRFLSGDRGLTTATVDKLAETLGLKLVETRGAGRPRKGRG